MDISILIKKVGQPAERAKIDNDDLTAMQALVGGNIETYYGFPGVTLFLNEDGKFNGSQPNFHVVGDVIMGDVFVTGLADDEGESTGLTDAQAVTISHQLTLLSA